MNLSHVAPGALDIALSITLAIPSLGQSNSQQCQQSKLQQSSKPARQGNDGSYRGYALQDWYRPDRD